MYKHYHYYSCVMQGLVYYSKVSNHIANFILWLNVQVLHINIKDFESSKFPQVYNEMRN